jgi:aspartate ammonia-lyase
MLPHAEVSPNANKQTDQSFNLRLPPTKRSTNLTRIRTLAKDKSHLVSSQELSREEFKDFLAKAREKLVAKCKLPGVGPN